MPIAGMGPPEPVCGADSLVGEAGRHLDVDDDRLRPGEVDLAYQAGGVGGGAGDLASGFAQQPGQALPEQQGVVGDDQSHDASSSGIRAISSVPPSSRSLTDSRPPSASTRSASPRSPDPLRSAPPRPSSTIRATTAPWSTVIATDARVALACLAMLVRASAQTK